MTNTFRPTTTRSPARNEGSRTRPVSPPETELSLSTEPHRVAEFERSPDPYNTSGSFDRTKNWARVGKR